MKKVITLAFIAAVSLIACKSNKHSKEIKTIDSLYTVIDTIEKNLKNVDTAFASKTYTNYKTNLGLIKEYFDDKKEDSTWQTLAAYGLIRSSLKSFTNSYPAFCKEVTFSRNQLDSLKESIQNNQIPNDSVLPYTKIEAYAVDNLLKQTNATIIELKSTIHLYDSLSPMVLRYIERLKKSKQVRK